MTSPSTSYLITGGAGFIGSHLCETLLRDGHEVVAVDDLSTGARSNIAHLLDEPRFSFVRASIMDEVVMDRLTSRADTVVHLAAAVGVQLIVNDPVHTIATNILGTEQVLKCALRYECKVLVTSTSEVYGKGVQLPFREDDDVLLGPTSKSRWAYAASKMIDEFMGFAYEREYGLRTIICRLFNTVGPRQTGRYGMVIPTFVRQALDGDPLTVFGDGMQRRCFCDVRDVVVALRDLLYHADAPGRVYNIGSTEEVTIRELAERVREATGSESPIVHVPYEEAYAPGFEDMEQRIPDISRVEELVGWTPCRTLDEIIEAVVEHDAPSGAGGGAQA